MRAPRGVPSQRRDTNGARPHGPDVFAVASSDDASEEEVRTAALPAVHPAAADALHDVFAAGIAGDVEGADAGGTVLRGTKGHAAPPRT